MEAQGYSREAYEHSLEICGNKGSKNIRFREETTKPSPTLARVVYILKLERPLDTLQKVQYAAGMIELPASSQGIGEDGDASFCRINGNAKEAIVRWISVKQIRFKPTSVRISQAEKDLWANSMYPTLGGALFDS